MISTTAPPAPKPHLWQGHDSGTATPEPPYHLHIWVLKDSEEQGDRPSRKFTFPSLHHLTHATNELESAFSRTFEIRKCGVEAGFPDAVQEGRVNDGRTENVTIEYDSAANGAMRWEDFLAVLGGLEDEWERVDGEVEGEVGVKV